MAGALVDNTERAREFLTSEDNRKTDWVQLFDQLLPLMESLSSTGENKFKLTFLALSKPKSGHIQSL